MKQGRIIKQISNQYLVLLENEEKCECFATGKLRLGVSPKVGDIVFLNEMMGIEKIETRKNDLIRPNVANVDQLIILMSSKQPNFSNKLLDRMLVISEYHNITPIIVFTKMDLIHDELDEEINKYRAIGYHVITSDLENDLTALKLLFKNKISVLTGNSGVGKSTLLNKLNSAFQLKTQDTSKALGRGRHTTRHSELFEVCGGWVADTPGFSSLDFSNYNVADLSKCFIEFSQYECKFLDCVHINEPECGVKMNLGQIHPTRYQNYLEIIQLIKGERK